MTPSPPDIPALARRRANELRKQAFDDAARWLVLQLTRLLHAGTRRQEAPCRS